MQWNYSGDLFTAITDILDTEWCYANSWNSTSVKFSGQTVPQSASTHRVSHTKHAPTLISWQFLPIPSCIVTTVLTLFSQRTRTLRQVQTSMHSSSILNKNIKRAGKHTGSEYVYFTNVSHEVSHTTDDNYVRVQAMQTQKRHRLLDDDRLLQTPVQVALEKVLQLNKISGYCFNTLYEAESSRGCTLAQPSKKLPARVWNSQDSRQRSTSSFHNKRGQSS